MKGWLVLPGPFPEGGGTEKLHGERFYFNIRVR